MEGRSSAIRIFKRIRGCVQSIYLGTARVSWLLATIKDLILEEGMKEFWCYANEKEAMWKLVVDFKYGWQWGRCCSNGVNWWGYGNSLGRVGKSFLVLRDLT